eukprot:768722-Hanusia_phi.AAC.1
MSTKRGKPLIATDEGGTDQGNLDLEEIQSKQELVSQRLNDASNRLNQLLPANDSESGMDQSDTNQVDQSWVQQVQQETGIDLQSDELQSDELRSKAEEIGQSMVQQVQQVQQETGIDLRSDEVKATASAIGKAVNAIFPATLGEQIKGFCEASSCKEAQEAVGQELTNVAGMLSQLNIPIQLETVVGAFGALGDIAYACPMIAPVGLILVGVSNACKQAKYNKEQAEFMGERIEEISQTLKKLTANLMKKGAEQSVSVLTPLLGILKDAFEFTTNITTKGFMKSLFTYTTDRKTLQHLDKQITDAMQALGLAIANEQLELSLQMDDKLVKMMELLEKGVPAGCKEPAQIDPKVLAEIAERSGCTVANEMKDEIGSMSKLMMGEIQAARCVCVDVSTVRAHGSSHSSRQCSPRQAGPP